jgi:hypothetical protein
VRVPGESRSDHSRRRNMRGVRIALLDVQANSVPCAAKRFIFSADTVEDQINVHVTRRYRFDVSSSSSLWPSSSTASHIVGRSSGECAQQPSIRSGVALGWELESSERTGSSGRFPWSTAMRIS